MADPTKAQLIAQLDRARTGMSRSATELRHDLDVPQHLRTTFANHKGVWIGGAAALGWVIARLPGRRKKPRETHNGQRPDGNANYAQARKSALWAILLGALRMAFNALQPALTNIASRKLKSMAAERVRW